MNCAYGTVTIDGSSVTYKTCWTEYYLVESGQYTYDGSEFRDAFDFYGNQWQRVTAIPVPGYEDLKVKADGKRAYTAQFSCSDLDDLRAQAAQAAASAAQFAAGTIFPVGHQIVLMMSGNERQTFTKITLSGSMQFASSSSCAAS